MACSFLWTLAICGIASAAATPCGGGGGGKGSPRGGPPPPPPPAPRPAPPPPPPGHCGDCKKSVSIYDTNRVGIVQLFEWKFLDIARECETYLGPNFFYAVQVSPVADHVKVLNPWRPWLDFICYYYLLPICILIFIFNKVGAI